MGKITGYAKAKFINEGTLIEDNKKKQWLVGKQLGEGGFGAIYMASELPSKKFENVIKIEPITNGPLYTEVNFYMRVCKEQEINSWIKERKMTFLGVPKYISSGIFSNNENRFLVMDRYGDDLHKILMKTRLTDKCLLQIAINIVDILEYIHSRDYSHADIKALNILRGYQSTSKVYLLDFGMVTKFFHNGEHKAEKADPKCKHNGTLEFCPRDSHRGLTSCRRSDIESLMFNLIFWLTWDKNRSDPSERVGYGNLPWILHMKNLGSKSPSAQLLKKIADSKEKYMNEPAVLVEEVGLTSRSFSKYIVDVLEYTSILKYNEKPDYDYIRNQFVSAICDIENKPMSEIILKSVREIAWNEHEVNKTRKAQKSGQEEQKKDSNRKRQSSGNFESTSKTGVKKNRSKKLLLEINNSNLENEQMDNQSSAIMNQSEVVPSEISNESSTKCIIPKSALAQLGKRVKKSHSGLKENDASNSVRPKNARLPKRTSKKNPTEAANDVAASNNEIIPGKITLDQMKQNDRFKSSPRIRARRKNRSPISRSISCQTSPQSI